MKLGTDLSILLIDLRSSHLSSILQELDQLASCTPSVTVVKLDVTDPASIETAKKEIESKLAGKGLNLLINNAGIITRGLYDVTEEEMIKHFRTNCIGPLLIARSFLPLLKQAASFGDVSPMSCSRAAVVNISSNWASIGDNNSCGEIPYKVSKAGLNMVSANLTQELKPLGVMVVSIHPGWAMTDMGGPKANVPIDDSVSGMFNTLSKLHGEDDTGKFLNYKGEAMRW